RLERDALLEQQDLHLLGVGRERVLVQLDHAWAPPVAPFYRVAKIGVGSRSGGYSRPVNLDATRQAAIDALGNEYGIDVTELKRLPLGADGEAEVYRADTSEGRPWFVKLRFGGLDPATATIPRFLFDRGVAQIIPPEVTRAGALWVDLERARLL